MVVGSNPTEPTFEANFIQNASDSFQNAQVQPVASELLQLRELMYILLGNKGRRHLELRHKTNNGLFKLYEGELAFHHRSARGINEAKRILIGLEEASQKGEVFVITKELEHKTNIDQ